MSNIPDLERLMPELRAYARSLTGQRDTADDLLQDALERALRAETRPRRRGDLRFWLFRVIRNLHYDELRKLRVRREYLAREKRLLHDAREQTDIARDVLFRQAFERLPDEKREVLFLVDVIGLKYDEAAAVMGVAHGTVMSRVSRARQTLRAAVEGPDDALAASGEKRGAS